MADIEESINRAMQEGKFDNLSGRGKPLDLEDDVHIDPEWRLAHHMLASTGYTLPWIELRKEIEAEINTAPEALQQAWEWRNGYETSDPTRSTETAGTERASWQDAQRRFVQQVDRINKRIFDYNLQAPSTRFQLQMIKTEREITRVSRE